MRRIAQVFLLAVLIGWFSLVLAAPTESDRPWLSTTGTDPPRIHLYFFWSQHCPHCLAARPQIEEMARAQPWIALHSLEVSNNRANVRQYVEMAESLGQQAQSVPAFLFCQQMWTGWDSTTGMALQQALASCRAGSTTKAGTSPSLNLPLLGTLDTQALSLPLLTLLVAGMDAFNPCAFFVLLFLLSLLAHQQEQRRMWLIGGIFVLFSGLMYFAFMAAWLGIFRIMGALPWVTFGAGALALAIGLINIKDFFAFKQGVSLSIPEAQRADIFRRSRLVMAAGSLPAMLAATILLAIAANFYELLCTAGFPMVYTRILTMQVADSSRQMLYLALYNTIYVLPLLLIVVAFVRTVGGRKLSEREGRLLKLLSGLMMLELGLLLLAAPELLNHVTVSLGLVFTAGLLTWLAARFAGAPRQGNSG